MTSFTNKITKVMKDNFRSEFGSELTPELFSILKLEEIYRLKLELIYVNQFEQRLVLNLEIGSSTYGCALAVGATERVAQVLPMFEQKLRLVEKKILGRGIQLETQAIRSRNSYSSFSRLTTNVLEQVRLLIIGRNRVIDLGLLAGDYQG